MLFQAEEMMDAEKTILVADGGDFVGSAAYILRPRGPLKFVIVVFNHIYVFPNVSVNNVWL